tara:strand:- start:4 stop:375 length:372 start_codon:yes stop_codon:yes gene_type:complete
MVLSGVTTEKKMQYKSLSQSGATMQLNNANIGYDTLDFAQHQIQISGLASGETATLHTASPASDNDSYVAVQEVLGSDAANHMIVLSPESGRHQKLKIVFSNGSGSAVVVINSMMGASHAFGV